ncbi:MAG: ATP synthase F0 subunit B [Acidobacteriota bacterium]
MSLDITFVYSFVVVLLSALFLRSALFGPISKVLDDREKKVKDDAQKKAQAVQDSAARVAEYETRLQNARGAAYRQREEARRQAADARGALLSSARNEADKLVAQGKAAVKQASVEATGPLMGEAEKLASMVVASILGRAA